MARGYVELDRELEQYCVRFCRMGRTERLQALGLYATGLLLSGERKSIAPMAARPSASAAEADAMRQRPSRRWSSQKWGAEGAVCAACASSESGAWRHRGPHRG